MANRIIKVKVWDKDLKEWVGNGEAVDLQYSMSHNCFLFDNDSYDIPKNIELVEWTGLKDKNGKGIYEGDALQISMGGEEQNSPFIVENLWDLRIGMENSDSYMRIDEEVEIIGNIYENPELLEDKQ